MLGRKTRQKRGGGQVLGETEIPGPANAVRLQDFPGNEPTPEFAAVVEESYRILLETLPDETLRTIALMKLQGFMNQEIADRLAVSRKTISRKLNRIRGIWDPDRPTTSR